MTEGAPLPRRALGALALGAPALGVLALAAPRPARSAVPVRLRDLLGREVVLPRPAQRIVLGQGWYLPVLGLLHPDPASLLAGWCTDFLHYQPQEYAAWRRRFPALDAIPRLAASSQALTAEAVLAVQPDLVLLNRWGAGHASGTINPMIGLLEAAGVPVAVVDFFVDPFRDTEASLTILGGLLGREAQAAALAAFRRERLDAVARRLAGVTTRPLMMLHVHAGAMPCCASPGRGTFDAMIRAAGGTNLGAELLPGAFGQISPEALLSHDPAVYVGTGGSFAGQGLSLGAGVTEVQARASLDRLLQEPALSALSAVRNGRAHAIWHGFNDTPAHFVMVEALARWLHPGHRADLDPGSSLDALNTRFAAVPMEGAYWVDPGSG